MSTIDKQSPDISQGVDTGGAGDQGMMFGYASDETDEFMPMPITLAHRITARLAELRKSKAIKWLRPDAKSQVTIAYDEQGVPVGVDMWSSRPSTRPMCRRRRSATPSSSR